LWLLPALAIFFAVTARRARQELARFGSPELLARAGAGVAVGLRRLKLVLLFTGLALVITALAQPQWGATREKIERKGVEVVAVLDTSLSMNATDVAPSRLHKAKQAILQLIEIMQGDSIAIVVFAGEAFTLCPLTLDYNAARMFVDIIDAEIVLDPGINIASGLREAA